MAKQQQQQVKGWIIGVAPNGFANPRPTPSVTCPAVVYITVTELLLSHSSCDFGAANNSTEGKYQK